MGLASVLPGREGKGDTFTHLCPIFRPIEGGQGVVLVFASSQLSSAQNNPMRKWHILGWRVLPPCTYRDLSQDLVHRKDSIHASWFYCYHHRKSLSVISPMADKSH